MHIPKHRMDFDWNWGTSFSKAFSGFIQTNISSKALILPSNFGSVRYTFITLPVAQYVSDKLTAWKSNHKDQNETKLA
jgi:hypothetical protein